MNCRVRIGQAFAKIIEAQFPSGATPPTEVVQENVADEALIGWGLHS